MNCERYQAALSDYADGTLQASERPQDVVECEAIDAHVAGCARCRGVVEDLHTIRETARTLDRQAPPPEVWMRIAGAIEGTRPESPAAFLLRREVWAVAALVVLMVGGSWYAWRQLPAAPPFGVDASGSGPSPDPALMQDIATQLELAEQHYTRAIAGLEAITRAERGELDDQTAGVLQANLTVIDQAIGESRAALAAAPASDVAQDSLFEALRSKVTLLQDTIALINEMRTGNQEETARIVSGMNQ